MTSAVSAVSGVSCPMCGSSAVEVVEQIAEGVVVFACDECGATWADRIAPRPEPTKP